MNEKEKLGLEDLLLRETGNDGLVQKLIKSISSSMLEVTSAIDAFETLCVQCPDIRVLLHKKLLTKEILYRYLTKRKVLVPEKSTKVELIEIILRHWNEKNIIPVNPNKETQLYSHEFPINMLALNFTEWFFGKYNTAQLSKDDFWSDCKLQIRIAYDGIVEEKIIENADLVLEALLQAKKNFNFYFNPNLSQNGVQGRYDVHGMAIVLSCGTLHRQPDCVGVFEAIFGLLRDPFVSNNWKTKMIECIFKGSNVTKLPSLNESNTFEDMLNLPAIMEN